MEKAVLSPSQALGQHLWSPVGMATASLGWCHVIVLQRLGLTVPTEPQLPTTGEGTVKGCAVWPSTAYTVSSLPQTLHVISSVSILQLGDSPPSLQQAVGTPSQA